MAADKIIYKFEPAKFGLQEGISVRFVKISSLFSAYMHQGQPAQWGCRQCHFAGKHNLTPCTTEYCSGSMHFAGAVPHGLPFRNEVTPSDGQGIYGVDEETKKNEWVCEEGWSKGQLHLNEAKHHRCNYDGCSNTFNPITEDGGWLYWICLDCTKAQWRAQLPHEAPDRKPVKFKFVEQCDKCSMNFKTEYLIGRVETGMAAICPDDKSDWVKKFPWLCRKCVKANSASYNNCRWDGCDGNRDNGQPYAKWDSSHLH